jgi:hypothetical protein
MIKISEKKSVLNRSIKMCWFDFIFKNVDCASLMFNHEFGHASSSVMTHLSTDPMVQWLRLPTANPEVLGSNPGYENQNTIKNF